MGGGAGEEGRGGGLEGDETPFCVMDVINTYNFATCASSFVPCTARSVSVVRMRAPRGVGRRSALVSMRTPRDATWRTRAESLSLPTRRHQESTAGQEMNNQGPSIFS